jgi:A/G-specific adenine glycosylase
MCQAQAQGEPLAYPVKTRKLKRSSATLWLLWAVNAQGQVWLQKRPDSGIWAGLFSVPVFDTEAQLLAAWPQGKDPHYIAPWKHVLTHRDLHLHPVRLRGSGKSSPAGDGRWVDADAWPGMGLPAPIRSLLAAQ